jgi:hypothetical protein
MDGWKDGPHVYVIYRYNHAIQAREYSLNGSLTGDTYTLLTDSGLGCTVGRCGEGCGDGCVESEINSLNVARCAMVEVEGDSLVVTGSKYEMDHIGVDPSTIFVAGTGGSCLSVSMTPGSFENGYKEGESYFYDEIGLSNKGSCSSFTADYSYTNCSLEGEAAFHCPMAYNPDIDLDVEYGYCKLIMLYEGKTGDDRVLLLAHAQELVTDDVEWDLWQRYLPSEGEYPTAEDVLIKDDGPHLGGEAGEYSFVSVPTLIYDAGDMVWRAWFVTADHDDVSGTTSAVRYSESPDDGLQWGIGSYSIGRDCWITDSEEYDPTACEALDWTVEPPNDDFTLEIPDIVDPEVLPLQLDENPYDLELGMMFKGADRTCGTPPPESSDPTMGVLLFQHHQDFGDQSSSIYWNWDTYVFADTVDGVVASDHVTACEEEYVMDPEIVQFSVNKYILFANVSDEGGIRVLGSGFQCSDFIDNDSDGGTDFGSGPSHDVNCLSPTDDGE